MKKTIFLVLLLSASILASVLYSCSEHPQDSDDRTAVDRPDFSLDEVRSAFESDWARVPQTRAGEEFDDDKILAPGQVDPEWDALEVGYGNSDRTVIQAEVPFEARHKYWLVCRAEDGKPLYAPMPNRLVVLKDSETGETSSWLFFLISDAGGWLPNDPADFSGVALYTTLSGTLVCAGRFYCGELVGSASLLDESHSREENADKLAELLPKDIFVARTGSAIVSRNSDPAWSIDIEVVPIVAEKPIKAPEPTEEEEDLLKRGPNATIEIMNRLSLCGGGGGGSNSTPSNSYLKNPNIVANEKFIELLDELYEDCMGKRLINSITVKVTITSSDKERCEANTFLGENGTVSGCTISMGQQLIDTWSLMEELTHLYQNLHGGCNAAKLNKEVEAKLGWYTYLKRIERDVDTRDALGGPEGERYFEYMWECLLKKDMKSLEFFETFEDAAENLRNKIEGYKDEKFDPGKMDCANLLELLKDCEYL